MGCLLTDRHLSPPTNYIQPGDAMTVVAGPSWRIETWSAVWGPYSAQVVRLGFETYAWVIERNGREVKTGGAGTPAGAKHIVTRWIEEDRKRRKTRGRRR